MQVGHQGHGQLRPLRHRQLPRGPAGRRRAAGGPPHVQHGAVQGLYRYHSRLAVVESFSLIGVTRVAGRAARLQHEEERPEDHPGRPDHLDRRQGAQVREHRSSDPPGPSATSTTARMLMILMVIVVVQVDSIIMRANKMTDNGKLGCYAINGRTKVSLLGLHYYTVLLLHTRVRDCLHGYVLCTMLLCTMVVRTNTRSLCYYDTLDMCNKTTARPTTCNRLRDLLHVTSLHQQTFFILHNSQLSK